MSKASVIHDYIAGAIGGGASLIVGHPFDTIKVQLQTKQASTPYKGSWEAIKRINHQGLVKGYFRGMGFPLASYGIVNSIFFGVYGNTVRLLSEERQSSRPRPREAFVAGCVAGWVSLFAACPVDLVKVVLQAQADKKPGPTAVASGQYFKGPIQCSSWLLRTHGVSGFYRGYWAMVLRDVPTFGVYTLVYESLFQRLSSVTWLDSRGVCASLLSGGLAGVACWSLAMPSDNVKSLLQADTHQTRFAGTWDCVRYIYLHRGVSGFFTGYSLAASRAFLVNGVTFMFYEQTLRLLREWKGGVGDRGTDNSTSE